MDTSTNQIIEMELAPVWLSQILGEHAGEPGDEDESEIETPYELGFV
jgi:hypothetical protein